MAWTQERRVLLPLLGAVVLSVIVLTTVMLRSSFRLEQLRERSVVEATLGLATEKSDRLDKRIIEQDNAVASLTEGDPFETFGSRWLEVASVQSPTVRAVLLVDLDSRAHEVRAFASRAPGPLDDQVRRLVLQEIWPELDLNPGEELRHLHTSVGEKSQLLSYWQRERDGRRLLIIAYHDVPLIVHDLFPRLYSEEGSQPSRVNVVDSEGRIVFGPPLSRGTLTVGRPVETTLYKWRVNVSMVAATELAAAVERKRIFETALVTLSSFIALLGVLVIAIAWVRERRLAVAQSDFVANVSHELKTPLSLVRMFSELLLSGRAAPEKQKQYLEIVVAESERLTALIDNILDFARVERGKSAFEFRWANVREMVQRAIEVSRSRAERQGVRVLLSAPKEAALMGLIDERALEIALINLVDNALKYATGTEEVRVGLSVMGDLYRITVVDDGPGVPPQDQRRIFERFVRGPSRKGNEQVRGSGIGLSLVAQIAQAHGGRAWAEKGDGPTERPGARFVITFRRGRPGSDEPPLPPPPSGP